MNIVSDLAYSWVLPARRPRDPDPELGLPKESCCFVDTICRDPTQWVLTSGALVSTAGAVYGYVIGSYLLAGVATFLTGTAVLGCSRVWCLKPGHDLGRNVNKIAETYTKMRGELEEVKKNNKDFETSQLSLRDTLETGRRSRAHLERRFNILLKELDDTRKNFEETRTQLENLKPLYDKLKAALNIATDKIAELSKIESGMQSGAVQLGKEVKAFEEAGSQVSLDVKKLEKEKDRIDGENKELEGLLSEFDKKLNLLETTLGKIREENAHLEILAAQMNKTDETERALKEQIERLTLLVASLEQQNEAIGDI